VGLGTLVNLYKLLQLILPVRVSPDLSNLFDTVDDKLDTVLLIDPVVVSTYVLLATSVVELGLGTLVNL